MLLRRGAPSSSLRGKQFRGQVTNENITEHSVVIKLDPFCYRMSYANRYKHLKE